MTMIQLQVAITVDENVRETLFDLIRLSVEAGNKGLASSIVELLRTGANAQPFVEAIEPITATQSGPARKEKTSSDSVSKLIDAAEVSHLLGLSARTVWRLKDAGKIPKPVAIGRMVRWRKDEIDQWITEGCPPVVRWKWRSR